MTAATRGFTALALALAPLVRAADVAPAFTARVPMRDGVALATDVYLPDPASRGLPAILVRTPYGRERYNREYGAWKAWGYAIAIQDVRRTTARGEEALAYVDDGWGENRDGADTIEWLAKQEFCNGKVGTVGASAMGITQYMLAPAASERVACQYILVAAASLYHHAAYPGGELSKHLVEEWLLGNRFEKSLSFVREHPLYDDYWRGLDATIVADRVRAPAIHYGGWFDCFLEGTIAGFTSRVKRAPQEVARGQKLLIGPWLHGGPSAKKIGDFKLPANARRDPPGYEARAWFDCWLKGARNGAADLPAVTYYVMGPLDGAAAPGHGNEWRTAAGWPPPSRPVELYLRADRTLRSEPPREREAPAAFTADPKDPVPTLGGANLALKERGPTDHRPIERRADVLTFSTEPLASPLEVVGTVRARLWLKSNAPDTDLAVRLTDVYPDGRSILLCDGIRRAALRESFEKPIPLEPNEPVLISVDVGTTAAIFAPGHRLRIVISGSNHPRFAVNPNLARNQILIEPDRASSVVLP